MNIQICVAAPNETPQRSAGKVLRTVGTLYCQNTRTFPICTHLPTHKHGRLNRIDISRLRRICPLCVSQQRDDALRSHPFHPFCCTLPRMSLKSEVIIEPELTREAGRTRVSRSCSSELS